MKHIEYSDDARQKLLSGVEKIAKAVKVTLGPSGRNVFIRNKGEERPFSTKDGVTVAGQVSSVDAIEMAAIESMQDVANSADASAGDGTTTATILAEAILKEGLNFPEGLNLLDIKKGIDKAVKVIVEELKANAIQCSHNLELLYQTALVSSNYDKEVAQIVTDAFKVAGKQGVVNLKRSRSNESYLTTIKGMTLPMGYRAVYYVNDNENDTANLDKPYVFMTNEKITEVSPNFGHLLEQIHNNQDSLLIICKDIDPSVSDMLLRNKVDSGFKVCVCTAPGFGNEQADMLKDLGTVLGKQPFIENGPISFNDLPMEKIFDYIPQSEAVVIGKHTSSVKGALNHTEEIDSQMEARANYLREQLEKHKTEYEKNVIQTRISRLTDGIAYINIYAVSETEYIEKQHRIQDALYAVKSASEEGIIPGGGAALLSLSNMKINSLNDSIQYGIDIVMKAIKRPFYQILENVGTETEVRVKKDFLSRVLFYTLKPFMLNQRLIDEEDLEYCISSFNTGYDAKREEVVPDMIARGIIDPVKVTRTALENAASISGMLLTTECLIVDDSVYDKPITPTGY